VSDGETKYIYFEAKAIKGFEAKKTIAKHEAEGWQLTDQIPGTLRTELRFRKVRPETWATKVTDWMAGLSLKTKIVAVAAFFLFFAGVIAVGAMTEKNDKTATAADSSPTSAATPTETETPTEDATSTSTPTPEVLAGPITYKNNGDFQALLAGDGNAADFASKYAGETVQYDAYVGAMGPGNEGGRTSMSSCPQGHTALGTRTTSSASITRGRRSQARRTSSTARRSRFTTTTTLCPASSPSDST
jgi:hypothetical protein